MESQKAKPSTKDILPKELDYASGLETKRYNPDRLLEDKGWKLEDYDIVMRDDKVASIVNLKKQLTLSPQWEIVAPSNEETDEELATFVRAQLCSLKTSVYDIMQNLLDKQVYGFRAGELRWQIKDEYARLDDIYFMHPTYFDFTYKKFGEIDKVIIGADYGDTLELTEKQFFNKFVYMVNPYLKDGNYYGLSDLQKIYFLYYSKYNIMRFRNQYLQGFGMPTPLVEYCHTEMTDGELNDLRDQLDNFQNNQYFLIPSNRDSEGQLAPKFNFRLSETTGDTKNAGFNETIDNIDKGIARALLVPDKIGFSESAGGSYNLGENQFGVLRSIIEAEHRQLEDTFNTQIIKKIVDYNFLDVDAYPSFAFERLGDSLDKDILTLLLDQKIVDKDEKWIRKYMGAPELTVQEKEEIEKDNDEPVEEVADPITEDDSEVEDLKASIFKKEYKRLMGENLDYLKIQIQKKGIYTDRDLNSLKKLRLKKTELKRVFAEKFALAYGKIEGTDTLKSQSVDTLWFSEVVGNSQEALETVEKLAFEAVGNEEKKILLRVEDIIKRSMIGKLSNDDMLTKFDALKNVYIERFASVAGAKQLEVLNGDI